MNDPWGREGTPEVVVWNYNDFLTAWQYIEHDSPLGQPFFGMVMQPWRIELAQERISASQLAIYASVTYPCYQPFHCTQYPALNTLVRIDLPDSLVVHSNTSTPIFPPAQEQSTQSLGVFYGGTTKKTSWIVDIINNTPNATVTINVTAYGLIQNSLPATPFKNGTFYASYFYTDAIGGEQQLQIKL